MDSRDWFNYNIPTQGMTILTFNQQIPYAYEYLLALATPSYHNETDYSLQEVSWDTFCNSVDMQMDIDYLYIIQYSTTMCNTTASMDMCLQQDSHYDILESTANDSLMFTILNNTHFINLNSELVSTFMDDPRDTFNILIGVGMTVLIVCILLLMKTKALAKSAYVVLVLTSLIFGTYLLHVFGLIVVPICFSLPLHMAMDDQVDYFEIVSHSLVYSLGDYEPLVWVIGVVVHGIWVWSITLLFPFISCIYGLVLCTTCCDEDRADKLGLVVVIPMVWVVWFAIVLISIAYLVLFCVNMVMWGQNPITFNVNLNRNAHYFTQTLLGIVCMWIIVPICGCLMIKISTMKFTNKYTLKLTKRVKSTPLVQRSIKEKTTHGHSQREPIAKSMYHNEENLMIKHPDEENDIYEY
eukprot:145974_1